MTNTPISKKSAMPRPCGAASSTASGSRRRRQEDRVALSAHFIKTRQSSGPAETRRKLAHLRELADELSRGLAEAAADDDTMMAIVSVGASDPSRGSTPRRDALSLLGQRQEQVSSLSRWMRAAADSLA